LDITPRTIRHYDNFGFWVQKIWHGPYYVSERSGRGVNTWPNGKKHGNGTLTMPDGTKYDEEWKSGKKISSKKNKNSLIL